MNDLEVTEVRQLRIRLADLETRIEAGRRITAGLVFALVGLLVGFSLPWVMTTRSAYDDIVGVDNGITTWLDGWMLFGKAVGDLGVGWLFLPATVLPMVLAVLVVILLRSLSHRVAMAVVVLGWVGFVGLTLTWVASLSAVFSSAGSGLLVAAGASIVAALSGWSVRRMPLPAGRVAQTAATGLSPARIQTPPPPPPPEPTPTPTPAPPSASDGGA